MNSGYTNFSFYLKRNRVQNLINYEEVITLEWKTWLLISVIWFTFYLYAEVRGLRMRLRQLEKTNYPSPQEFSPELNQELAELVRQGKKVQAIKRVREEHGWTLLEAKQAVDRYEE